MKTKFFSLFVLMLLVGACTKEVPEYERKINSNVDENEVRKKIESYAESYNSGNPDALSNIFDESYVRITPEENDLVGLESFEKEITNYMSQYPGGKWKINIEQVDVSGELASVTTRSVFEKNYEGSDLPSTVYSERALYILKKHREGTWKIARSMSFPIYTYSEKN
ncbi:MAG: nuclear transport factor 2 family protein [Melioribacteraceae bacterium]|nr:nuclear transport factor 2 family protein [Melioribacteraceae bacterium]